MKIIDDKKIPLPEIWRMRNIAGIHEGKMLDFKIVFLEGERRALEKRLGYAVGEVELSSILRAIMTGKLGLKEL